MQTERLQDASRKKLNRYPLALNLQILSGNPLAQVMRN